MLVIWDCAKQPYNSHCKLYYLVLKMDRYEYLKRYSDSQYKLKGKNTPKWRVWDDLILL